MKVGLIGAGNMARGAGARLGRAGARAPTPAPAARAALADELGGEARRDATPRSRSAPISSCSATSPPQLEAVAARGRRRTRRPSSRSSAATPLADAARPPTPTRPSYRLHAQHAGRGAPGRRRSSPPTPTQDASARRATCASCSAELGTLVVLPTSRWSTSRWALMGVRARLRARSSPRRRSTPACAAGMPPRPGARELVVGDDGRDRRAAARARARHARRAPRGHLAGRVDRARPGRAGARRRARRVLATRWTPSWAVTAVIVLATRARPHRRLRRRADHRLHAHHHRLHPRPPVLLVRRAARRTRAGRARCSTSCATSASPYLRIFRRFIPQFGPLDLSPMVAIIVLQIVGGIIVGLIRGVMRAGAPGRAPALVAVAVVALDQVDQGARAHAASRAASERRRPPAIQLVNVAQHRRRVQLALRRRRARRDHRRRRAGGAARATSSRHARTPARVAADRACCSAARSGNVIDRVRAARSTDFIKLAALAGVQRRRHLRSRSACSCCSYVIERARSAS